MSNIDLFFEDDTEEKWGLDGRKRRDPTNPNSAPQFCLDCAFYKECKGINNENCVYRQIYEHKRKESKGNVRL